MNGYTDVIIFLSKAELPEISSFLLKFVCNTLTLPITQVTVNKLLQCDVVESNRMEVYVKLMLDCSWKNLMIVLKLNW